LPPILADFGLGVFGFAENSTRPASPDALVTAASMPPFGASMAIFGLGVFGFAENSTRPVSPDALITAASLPPILVDFGLGVFGFAENSTRSNSRHPWRPSAADLGLGVFGKANCARGGLHTAKGVVNQTFE
jgi:hypothetical protein